MIFALRKPYLIAGQRTPCLEIFDWHTLPDLKGSGVGIRVMRALMREGERVIAIGGTSDALSTLPAMGWQPIGSAQTFELPLSGDVLAASLRNRISVRIPCDRLLLAAVAGSWFWPRRRAVQGQAVPMPMLDGEVQDLYDDETGYDVLQLPDISVLQWMTAANVGNGRFGFVYFRVREKLRGWALTRIYETEEGREAKILEVFAPSPNLRLYTWMVSEAASSLAGARPRVIRARASCPILQAALRANRFRQGSEIPIHTWPKTTADHLRLHVTLNHTDEGLRPYETPDSAAG